jgi:predicted phage gp36 major capsid-like protein
MGGTVIIWWADDMVAQQRAALVVFCLCRGDRLTTAEVGELAGLSPRGARTLLDKISAVTPLYREGAFWVMLPREQFVPPLLLCSP